MTSTGVRVGVALVVAAGVACSKGRREVPGAAQSGGPETRAATAPAPGAAALAVDAAPAPPKPARPGKTRVAPTAISFSPSGDALAVAAGDTLVLWSVDGKEETRALVGHRQPIAALGFAGSRPVSADAGGTVIVWNRATGEPVSTSEPFPADCQPIAIGAGLLVAGQGTSVRVWSLDANQELGTFPVGGEGGQGSIVGAAVAPSAGWLAVVVDAGPPWTEVVVLELPGGALRARLPGFAPAFDKAAGRLAVLWSHVEMNQAGDGEHEEQEIDVQPLPEGDKQALHLEAGALGGLAFSEDGEILALAREQVELWIPAAGRVRRKLPIHATSVAMHPRGRLLAAVTAGKVVELWDHGKNAALVGTLVVGAGGAWATISPAGEAAGSADLIER